MSDVISAWFDEAGTRTCAEFTATVFRGTGSGGGFSFVVTEYWLEEDFGFSSMAIP